MDTHASAITLAKRPQVALAAYARRLGAAQSLFEQGDTTGAARDAACLCADFPAELSAFVLHARCACAEGNWPETLQRWRVCASRFPECAEKWRMGLAHALLHTQQPEAAEAEFAAILAIAPDHIAAMAGRAQAASATAPERAIGLWRAVLKNISAQTQPAWRLALARLLLAQGQAAEAEAITREILAATPQHPAARAFLLHLLIETDSKAQAAIELAKGHFSSAAGASPAEQLRLQSWLGDIKAARHSFVAALQAAGGVAELTALFAAVPLNFEVFARGEIWRAMRVRLDRDAAPSDPSANCLRLRLDLALRDYDGFLDHFDAAPTLSALGPQPWPARFQRLADILRAPAFPDFTAPRIFGIGLTKTGTTSLGRALESLGYLHAHFTNPFTCEIIGDEDFPLFDAVTDSPASLRFETLYHSYPNAKFILTERALPDWESSFERHFARSDGSYDAFRNKLCTRQQMRHGAALARLHAGLYLAHPDPATAHQAYTTRVDDFFATKPAGKLLRHNVFAGDGWPSLCAFLDRAIPAAPYPWINKTGPK